MCGARTAAPSGGQPKRSSSVVSARPPQTRGAERARPVTDREWPVPRRRVFFRAGPSAGIEDSWQGTRLQVPPSRRGRPVATLTGPTRRPPRRAVTVPACWASGPGQAPPPLSYGEPPRKSAARSLRRRARRTDAPPHRRTRHTDEPPRRRTRCAGGPTAQASRRAGASAPRPARSPKSVRAGAGTTLRRPVREGSRAGRRGDGPSPWHPPSVGRPAGGSRGAPAGPGGLLCPGRRAAPWWRGSGLLRCARCA